MTAKQYLSQVRQIEARIQYKMREIDKLTDMLYPGGESSNGIKVQTSYNGDKRSEAIDLILDIRAEVNKDILRLNRKKRDIEKKLDKLKPEHVTLLYKRYFEFKTYEIIAEEMGYSLPWIYRTHKQALEEFSKLI